MFLSPADFFFKINVFEIFIQEYHGRDNSLDPDQARQIVGPDLGPNSLQMLSADDTSRQRVNKVFLCQDQKSGTCISFVTIPPHGECSEGMVRGWGRLEQMSNVHFV